MVFLLIYISVQIQIECKYAEYCGKLSISNMEICFEHFFSTLELSALLYFQISNCIFINLIENQIINDQWCIYLVGPQSW